MSSFRLVPAAVAAGWLLCGAAGANGFNPPMLDISAQCGRTFHSASAMSECVVAESEARAELLSHWTTYSDSDAERCIKLGRKAKRQPYTAMAACLAPGGVPQAAAASRK